MRFSGDERAAVVSPAAVRRVFTNRGISSKREIKREIKRSPNSSGAASLISPLNPCCFRLYEDPRIDYIRSYEVI
jgi:hypothetical protein